MSTLFTRLQKQKSPSKPKVKKSPFKDSYSEFDEWYNDFYALKRGFIPNDLRAWFERVEDTHRTLREIIGGIRVCSEYMLEAYQSVPPQEIMDEIIRSLRIYLPDYFADERVSVADLSSPNLPSGMKTSKHIMQYATDFWGKTHVYLPEVNKIVSKLGEAWAKAKTTEATIYTVLSTAAKAFCLLGHYGPDNNSCFRQGTGNSVSKYNLGERNNSFVFLIRSSPIRVFEPENSDTILARMWGFVNTKDNVVNFCNYYPKAGFVEGNAFEACRRQAAQILGLGLDEITCTKNIIRIGEQYNIYHNQRNHQPNWSFHSNLLPIGTQEIT